MNISLINSLALLAFILVQVMALAIVLIIRYHFKLFAVPQDPRAQFITKTLTRGAILIAFIAAVLLAVNF